MSFFHHSIRLVVANLVVAPFLLGVSSAATLTEKERFGFGLPVDTQTAIWTKHLTTRDPARLAIVHQGIEFLSRDEFKNIDKGVGRGISARKVASKEIIWHTPFPAETPGAPQSDTRQIESSTLVLRGNRLLCTYLVTPGEGAANGRFWEFVIVDTATGKIVRRERAKVAVPQVQFTIIGDYWFVTDERAKKTFRLEPATGEPLWTHDDVLKFSALTEQSISFFQGRPGATWQVTALDLFTGKTLFSQRFDRIDHHIIKGVLARDGRVFVEFGAQYDWNLERGAMYRTYTVAFDATTGKPIWRTKFFD